MVPADGWRAGVALAELESAVQRWCGALAAGWRPAPRRSALAAEGYEAVDERAARRLAGVPR